MVSFDPCLCGLEDTLLRLKLFSSDKPEHDIWVVMEAQKNSTSFS